VVVRSLCEHRKAHWGGGNKDACRSDQDGSLQYKDEIQGDAPRCDENLRGGHRHPELGASPSDPREISSWLRRL